MNGQIASGSEKQQSSRSTVSALLACGIVSSVLYIATDIVAAIRWVGYSYVNQAVSELNAVGAPTRPLTLVLFSAYNVLVIAFALGVWASADKKRSLRAAAIMLAVYAAVGQLTIIFSPMNQRGVAAMAANDFGHITLTALEVLSLVLFMSLGSAADGRWFRVYSIATIVAVIAAGAVTGMLSTHMTALASSTPWAGLVERVNIYATMMWIGLFAVVLRRANAQRASLPSGDAAQGSRRKKKVTVLLGSPHKGGATLAAARKFLDNLESFGDVQGEIVPLSEYDIGVCRGCKVCFDRGEEFCPLKDDRDVLIEKMADSDGIVFASPNYSFQVAGVVKVFLDRLGFAFHRPRFHGKTATAIVVQGFYRGRPIRTYLEFVAGGLGFKVVRGSVIKTLEPMSERALRKMDKSLAEQSRRFHEQLLRPARPTPSLIELMAFRMSRTGIKLGLAEDNRDYMYYRDHGWFESEFYYSTRLGPMKKIAAAFFDWAAAHTSVFDVAEETPRAVDPTSSNPAAQ